MRSRPCMQNRWVSLPSRAVGAMEVRHGNTQPTTRTAIWAYAHTRRPAHVYPAHMHAHTFPCPVDYSANLLLLFMSISSCLWFSSLTNFKHTNNTYSSIFLVHKLRQTELTKEGRSKWRLWPLRPAVSCTCDGADWPKVGAVGAQQPISDFFGFIQTRNTLSRNGEHLRVAEVKSFPAIPKSMRSVSGDRNGANLKKVVSLAGLHHTNPSYACKLSHTLFRYLRLDSRFHFFNLKPVVSWFFLTPIYQKFIFDHSSRARFHSDHTLLGGSTVGTPACLLSTTPVSMATWVSQNAWSEPELIWSSALEVQIWQLSI